MAHFQKTAAFAALTTVLSLSAVIFAQQNRVANTASNVAINVTNDVLRRRRERRASRILDQLWP